MHVFQCKISVIQLYILKDKSKILLSGTTGQPKGVQHPTGGHSVVNKWTMQTIFGSNPGDIWYAPPGPLIKLHFSQGSTDP